MKYLNYNYIKQGINWRLQRFNKKYIFKLHNMIVSTFFGKIKHDYSDFQIDDNDLNILRDIFKDSKQISFSNYINIKDDVNYNIFLKKNWNYNKRDGNIYKQFDETQNWYDIKFSQDLEKFTKKLFPKFKEYLMSNFSIVNLRAWKNLPNAYIVKSESGQERGTHRVHTDGFPPGHIKCMIYLQPLDEDHGLFELDEKKIEYDKPGYGIIFKNSDIPHRAIPGLKKDRYVLEYTLMRTLFKVNETKYIASKPDSTYLSAPYWAYL